MKLYFVNGDRSGSFWELVPPGICIGREEDNDIQLLLPGISRYHAKVEYTGSQWRILDLGSTNGTRVNGNVITDGLILQDGMLIQLGEQKIRFVANNESGVSPEADVPRPGGSGETPLNSAAAIPPAAPSPVLPSAGKADRKADPAVAGEKGNEKKFVKINAEDLFRKKEQSSPVNGAVSGREGHTSGKRIQNLLFTLLVVVMGCAALLVFVMLNTPAEKKAPVQNIAVRNPFVLEYEKKLIQSDNVFRFYVRVEDKSVIFKLNDLRHSRHFTKGIGQVDEDLLRDLIKEVKDTDFMKIVSGQSGKPRDGVDEYRKMTIGYGSHLNTVVCHNTAPPRSFEAIEGALESFADGFGLKTISLSEEQMRSEADRAFEKAEDLFKNYQARPENLRNAIVRYQITVEFLEQFEPKPRNWIAARQRLNEANKLLNKLKKDCEFNINVYYKKRQSAEAVAECNRLLHYLDPEERSYQKIRNLKIVLERQISLQKKNRARR